VADNFESVNTLEVSINMRFSSIVASLALAGSAVASP
jgi:hypothetical protein